VQPVAVVTGASSGIGEAIARGLARAGTRCVLVARREELLRSLSDELGAEYETCDVADRNAVERVATTILGRHPQINVLVNNAGVPARASFLDGDVETALRTNYLGSVWCLRAFLPGLEAAAPSDVVNIVSIAGAVALPQSGPYAASKAAQLAFSRATAAQLAATGIRVHTVKPGFVETPGFPQAWLPRPLRRLAVGPERVADHVLAALESGRGRETTVPRFYAPAAIVQAVAPNLLARALVSTRGRSTIRP
jgi:NAD(P)-dependent dehydrogenase (short-subunit alcohol dehydrogenase family)